MTDLLFLLLLVFVEKRQNRHMREAAETLREVSRLYDAFDPEFYPWTPKELEHEANMIEVPF